MVLKEGASPGTLCTEHPPPQAKNCMTSIFQVQKTKVQKCSELTQRSGQKAASWSHPRTSSRGLARWAVGSCGLGRVQHLSSYASVPSAICLPS